MKRKIFSTLLALALLLTLGLVTAAPVAAQDPPEIRFKTWGDGYAGWTADESYAGDFSVAMDAIGPSNAGKISVPIDPILFQDLTSVTYMVNEPVVVTEPEGSGIGHPYINLILDLDGNLETVEDQTYLGGLRSRDLLGDYPEPSTWTEMQEDWGFNEPSPYLIDSPYGWDCFCTPGDCEGGVSADYVGTIEDFQDFMAEPFPDAVVYELSIMYGWWDIPDDLNPVYVDDVKVNGVTYAMEPQTIVVTMSPEVVAADVSKEITFTVQNTVDSTITQFELIVPKDGDAPQYVVSEVVTPNGWIMSYSTDMASGRVSRVTWTASNSGIPYEESQDFVITANTPSATGDYVWEYNITNAFFSQEGSVVQGVDGDDPVITEVTADPAPNAAGWINEDAADISATITDAHLDADSLKVYYSTNEGADWDSEAMENGGEDDVYSATLEDLDEGELRYYIYAKDTVDPNEATDPVGAPEEYHSFTVDTVAPNAPVFAELTVNENAPGTADSIEGAAGAVEANALVEVWNDATTHEEANLIGSIAAAADGSFAAIEIGDDVNDQVWVTAKDAADNSGEATSVVNDIEDPEIISVDWAVDSEKPAVLALGDVIDVTMEGELGCTGTFDIGTIATGIAMTESEGTYTGSYIVQSGDDGDWTVTGYLTDGAGNTSETPATPDVKIITDETPPVIGVPAVEYPVGVYSARVGDPVIISVEVTDPGEPTTGVVDVILDATAIGGSEEVFMTQVDDTDIWTTGTGEPITVGEVEPGIKILTITAADGAGLPADPVEVEVEVTLALTGYNVELAEGWNLMSLPLIPEAPAAIGTILAPISGSVDFVWGYDPSLPPADQWALYTGEIVELTEMVDGLGYWVYMNAAATLTISGLEMPEPGPTPPPYYDVAAGWNLIGVKSVDAIPYGDYLGSLGDIEVATDYAVIWAYDPVEGYVNVFPVGEISNLTPGNGYWLWMKVAGIVVPPQ